MLLGFDLHSVRPPKRQQDWCHPLFREESSGSIYCSVFRASRASPRGGSVCAFGWLFIARSGFFLKFSRKITSSKSSKTSVIWGVILGFTGFIWGRCGVCMTFTWSDGKLGCNFQVLLCQCSCYVAEDQQFQWLEKVRGTKAAGHLDSGAAALSGCSVVNTWTCAVRGWSEGSICFSSWKYARNLLQNVKNKNSFGKCNQQWAEACGS